MKTGIVILTMLTLGAIVITMTCCGNGDVTKGENNTVVEEPNAEPETPPQTTPPADPEPEISNLDKAREAYNKANQRFNEILNENPQRGLNEAYNQAFEEVLGFGVAFVEETLEKVYFEERPEEKGGKFTQAPLILEYLRLSFKFPNKREEGLLRLFRESVREGNVSIDIDNPKPSEEPEEDGGESEDGKED